jgi:hypothetical protein
MVVAWCCCCIFIAGIICCFISFSTHITTLSTMTPQKAFMENLHFWFFPFVLVILKVLFDLLPRVLFIVLFGAGIGIFFMYDKYSTAQKIEEAVQLEKSTDSFLEELNESERVEQEAKDKKKQLKEKKKEERLRQQELLQKKNATTTGNASSSKSSKKSSQKEEDDDEDDDEMFKRMVSNKKKK